MIHQPMRRVRQPLSQRDVLILRRRENLEKNQIRVAQVFDVVRHRSLNVSHIALMEIHRPRVPARCEYRHAPRALHVVLPLVLIRMPVQLAQTAWFQGHDRCRNIGGWKVFRVNDLYLAPLGYLGGLHPVSEESEGIWHCAGDGFHLLLLFRKRSR